MDFGRVLSVRPTLTEEACCVAWSLSKATRIGIRSAQLKALHLEIQACSEIVGAVAVEAAATHGVLRLDTGDATFSVTAEDSAVRLGQLLCRWGAEQEPVCSIQIGVHTGELSTLSLPGLSLDGCFGAAVTIASELAVNAPKDLSIHLLKSTKEKLAVFEQLPFIIRSTTHFLPDQESYHLDWWVDGSDMVTSQGSLRDFQQKTTKFDPKMPVTRGRTESTSLKLASKTTTMEQFTSWLEEFGIDTKKFGRGQAKRLEDFFKEIVEHKRSYLVERDGKLERILELVRINLCATDAIGTERSLKVAMDIMDDGRTRKRNQKLATVVPEGSTWMEAVRQSFEDKFQLSRQVQEETISVKDSWYKEEHRVSPSIPGIETTYLTHEVRMSVLNPQHSGLRVIGLPTMKNFTTTSFNSGKQSSWAWMAAGEASDDADHLTQLLLDHGINPSEFEPGAFNDLLEEVYETRISELVVHRGELLRHLQIIKVWLSTDILSVPHVLVTVAKVQKARKYTKIKDRPISMRMASGQGWQEALRKALLQRLGLDVGTQERVLVDTDSYRILEEVEYSCSFPGLKTVYRIHEVKCRCFGLQKSHGLPEGQDFSFLREEGGDVVVTYYSWKSEQEVFGTRKLSDRERASSLVPRDSNRLDCQPDPKRRLPLPAAVGRPCRGQHASGCPLLEELMRGKQTDWERARNAAKRIRDEDYTCGDFFQDCTAAFPELLLYLAAAEGDEASMTSGRSADDEYQRTLGALFALYWLMRLNSDGAQSFVFGIGNAWEPLSPSSSHPRRTAREVAQRSDFLAQVRWSLFEDVLIAAGLLHGPGGKSEGHNEERTLAMLALTAIHDIMKVRVFLPVVDRRHGTFGGYKPGEVINDHDVALGYVLEFRPNLLPSFAGLPPQQKESVKFTQCQMEYNMGWFVQAEAPPGQLFRKFKSLIRKGQASPSDIAFYFTHWLTDLAGAEPFPQEGCEKFVLKFPQKVLVSFLNSFAFVQHLSSKTETAVFEDYLRWRWAQEPSLGPVPSGGGSIARLRLVAMAQGHSDRVLTGFQELHPLDRRVLEVELARTGCQDQAYVEDKPVPGGPAFLVYYAPALLQKNCGTDAVGALAVLADVLRQARALWPLKRSSGNMTVTVRIDVLKELTVHELQNPQPGSYWSLKRLSDIDGMVQKASLLTTDGSPQPVDGTHRILTFRRPADISSAAFSENVEDCFGDQSELMPWWPCVDAVVAKPRHCSLFCVRSIC